MSVSPSASRSIVWRLQPLVLGVGFLALLWRFWHHRPAEVPEVLVFLGASALMVPLGTVRPLGLGVLGLAVLPAPALAVTLHPSAVGAALALAFSARRFLVLRPVPLDLAVGAILACWLGAEALVRAGLDALGAAASLGAVGVLLGLGRLRPHRPGAAPSRGRAGAIATDALLWLGGMLLVPAVSAAGTLAVAPLLLLVGALAALLHYRGEQLEELQSRVDDLHAMGALALQYDPEGSRLSDLAARIVDLLRRSVDFVYCEIRLPTPDADSALYWARAQGPVAAGPAEPGSHPPPRPGIHRRRPWRLAEAELGGGDGPHGHVRLWCDPRAAHDDPEHALGEVVPQIDGMLDRLRLDHAARRDALTGLLRRRVFDERLARAFERCAGGDGELSVALFDLDHFKQVNDTLGHPAGDRALAHVAEILSGACAETDSCCRYGGEEFVVLMPDTSSAEALERAERVRLAVESSPVALDSAQPDGAAPSLELTVSAGTATFPELWVQSAHDLLELADQALYAAKQEGRNRCLAAAGRGRFRTPSGRLVGTATPLQAPRL